MSKQMKQVVSYADDVHVWVYLDSIDRVLRYEAFVIGYNSDGEPETLQFVIEEGVLDTLPELPFFDELCKSLEQKRSWGSSYQFTVDGRLVSIPPFLHFYTALNNEQIKTIHEYFHEREKNLKRSRRRRWTRMLRALGYDVIARV